ncbi:T-complex protein 1 subunit theta-like isoform X1 [Biomphalaria glabrata]|uniref:T-complex protein 1 subunit theta n=2 Tax=Biomphalaria glabrata TaxID=6526 RepID=A0A9W3AQ00_BIOGL|nr:T-complex protein 1 subunit theta-like isoform X1 [Biomphalaria glabrata]
MALHVPRAPGFAQMMKDGARHFSGLEEAVYRNIDACRELAKTTISAFGPHGQNKMVINHLEKLFVTNDAATILRELEVEHPAAKILVMASQQQEQECGDGTNFVLGFAGALLENAEELLRMGLSVAEVTEGYEMALKKALNILEGLSLGTVKNLRNKEEVLPAVRSAVMSKQYGNEDFLANVIADACISILPEKVSFSVDNIRVCKILGSGILQSSVVSGMVFKRLVEGDVTKVEKAKIAVFSCPLDSMQTETKGTVLIKNADELMSFSKGEENLMEQQIKEIADAGVNVVVTGGKVGDLALHYANKYKLMVVRLLSKWDLRRLCKSINATALPKLTAPTAEELGYCDNAYVDEIGDTPIIVFKQDKKETPIATIVIRGSTENIMDDIERAIDDGVNTFKALTKDNRILPGAGAVEIELATQISTFGESLPGLEQYSVKKFAESLEMVPKALAQNAGIKATDAISKLYAAHHEKKVNAGIDIEAESAAVMDAAEAKIFDLYITKYWGLKFATSAACTVLRVDQIIMAKRAGGPKAKQNKDWDED